MRKLFLIVLFFLPFALKAQILTTIAGNGSSGDGLPASAASINDPNGLVVDKYGNLYFSENLSHKVRKIDTSGIITTIAGTGAAGFNGDGGLATAAKLNEPCGITVDTLGNVFIADGQNYRVRKVTVATGIITTVVGNSTLGFAGDGGPASAATISSPSGVCFDHLGNLYIADYNNSRIRKINTSGTITTVAGNGMLGSIGDGGPATAAKISAYSVCTDKHNNLYIAEWGTPGETVRKVDMYGIISTITGDTTTGLYNGDGIPATSATLDPNYLVFDDSGKLYISDFYNNRIRMIDTFGIIHTIAGNGIGGFTGDGGEADLAEIHSPSGIAIDACGNLYLGQVNTPRIRKVSFNPTCYPYSHHFDSTSLAIKTMINNEVHIYPNPVYSEITIKVNNKIDQITITNLIGQTVYSQACDLEKAEVNIAGLPEGVYIVKVTDNEGNVTTNKIIKENAQ